jgi:hypothetical protein
MKKLTLALVALGAAWGIGAFQQGTDATAWLPIPSAHAIVGRPASPVSVAGVARRTTRRVIVATTVYVATLPPSCTVVVIEGTSLHHCGSTYYQASGTQYVVVNVN